MPNGEELESLIWGWLMPICKLLSSGLSNWVRKSRLRRCLEKSKFPEGRTIDALRRVAGEPDTDGGREHTRELLRTVKRRRSYARILKRDPNAEEMWGLRED